MFLLRKVPFKPSSKTLFTITTRFFATPSPYPPTAASYDELIATAAHSNDFTTLHHLLNKRYRDGFFNTSKTFNFLTQDPNPLSSLLQTLTTLDKGFARKNAFDCLIIHLCKSNRIDESLLVIDTMIENQIGANASTFHPIICALSRANRFDEAWGVIEKMKANSISVDISSFNYILTSYCFNGHVMSAVGVLEKIREDGLKEDMKTYDALVMGACKVGNVEGGLLLLRRVEEEGLHMQYSTPKHVLKGLIGLGCFLQAVEFVMAFVGRDRGLDTENFAHLLNSLVRKRRVDEAKFVYGEMEKRDLVFGEKLRNEYKNLLLVSESTEKV